MLKKNMIILENNLYLKMGLVKILESDYNIYSDIDLSKNLYDLMKHYKPDIIVINDLSKNNLKHVKRIRSEYPNTYVVILTSIILEDEIHEALLAGVSGYVLYNIKSKELRKAIDLISKGEYYFNSSTMTIFIKSYLKLFDSKEIISHLFTKREYVILLMLAEGKNIQEISQTLNISEKSIHININKIYNKLSVKTRIQAIDKAVKNRWIPYNLAISNLYVNYNKKRTLL
ncbi:MULTISPECIES: response regulator transcription factor [unclassified Lysinibacillus]|uniref:response regulator transcription factor n=2 Tax=Lysinibacillus TaxID=400634 RepID=UPI000888C034|nr:MULTISPECIES: response regulator transcription factor [unclassified Lysinibacillus]SCX95660.1 DNA-binding response regulator, NarL/FixJ family, contains REC and HTH domains [Lysinibacillus sp. SG9]SDB07527.1 DNA-binding response regulator, NarL/FixJ family, contains REC and HTH domains [Lysinibacillus sp. TC-37]SFS39880.1 DNA-binding response regulator, NarL/FixJ family, contains REC and HTH domains [Lysinibacillus sp. SG55]